VQSLKDLKCSKLKELKMYDCSAVHVFDTEVKFNFTLKTFGFMYLAPMTPNTIHNFEEFMLAQSSSLQCLVLWRCGMDIVEVSFKSLPLLKELKLYYLSASEDLHLTVNPSIEILALDYHYNSVQHLLVALPNLNTLELPIINFTVIETIAIAMNLREVT